MMNFIGPGNGQGIRVYKDGVLEGDSDTIASENLPAEDGAVVVGRTQTRKDDFYGSVSIDELLFFDEILTQFSITQLVQNV